MFNFLQQKWTPKMDTTSENFRNRICNKLSYAIHLGCCLKWEHIIHIPTNLHATSTFSQKSQPSKIGLDFLNGKTDFLWLCPSCSLEGRDAGIYFEAHSSSWLWKKIFSPYILPSRKQGAYLIGCGIRYTGKYSIFSSSRLIYGRELVFLNSLPNEDFHYIIRQT